MRRLRWHSANPGHESSSSGPASTSQCRLEAKWPGVDSSLMLLAPLALGLLPAALLGTDLSIVAFAALTVAFMGATNDVAAAWACRVVPPDWERLPGGTGRVHTFEPKG